MSKQNLTRIVGIWSGILISFGLVISPLAQTLDLERDQPVSVTIGDDPAWLTYDGTGGEVIQITTLTAITDTAPDTIIEILYPDNTRLAYGDDVLLSDGTLKSDATITDLELPIDGVYRIRIDSFNGVSAGEVDVVLTDVSHPLNVIETGDLSIIQGEIIAQGSLTYQLDVEADVALTLVARDISGTLDPVMQVYDAQGDLLAFNDDHQSHDLSLDVLDAQITDLISTADQTLTIVIQDYQGRSGTVELIISS